MANSFVNLHRKHYTQINDIFMVSEIGCHEHTANPMQLDFCDTAQAT